MHEMERRTQQARPFYRRRAVFAGMRALSLADYHWALLRISIVLT